MEEKGRDSDAWITTTALHSAAYYFLLMPEHAGRVPCYRLTYYKDGGRLVHLLCSEYLGRPASSAHFKEPSLRHSRHTESPAASSLHFRQNEIVSEQPFYCFHFGHLHHHKIILLSSAQDIGFSFVEFWPEK